MRAIISTCLFQSCIKTHNDPLKSSLELNSTLNQLMCNADSSVIVQKLLEKGFYNKLKELRHPESCYCPAAMQI